MCVLTKILVPTVSTRVLCLHALVDPLTAHTGAARFRRAAALLYSGARIPCAVHPYSCVAHAHADFGHADSPKRMMRHRERHLNGEENTSTIASKIPHLCCICRSNTAAAMHFNDHAQKWSPSIDGAIPVDTTAIPKAPSRLLSQDCVEASEVPSPYVLRWRTPWRASTSRGDVQNVDPERKPELAEIS